MKYLFSLIFILLTGYVFPQEAVVKDSVTGKPIFQVVVSADKNRGTVTNEKGEFSLSVFNNNDSLSFSHIAYNSKKVDYKTLRNNSEIFLSPATLHSRGITITSSNPKKMTTSFKEELAVTKEERMSYVSVGDYLKNQSSLYIKDYGGAAGAKGVSSRGMSSENTMVLFNEARVNDLRTGIFDFSYLDMNSVDKIIYLKSFDYDTPFSSPGGIVKLYTDLNNDTSKVFLSAKYSTDNLKSFGVVATSGIAGILFRINAERCWAANTYRYVFENTEHDRSNAWLSKTFLSGDIMKAGRNYTLKLYSNYSFFNSGIPGFVATNNLASSNASNKTVSTLNVLSADYFLNDNYSISGNVNYNHQSLVIDDPDGVIFYSNTKKESKLNDLTSSLKLKYSQSSWNLNVGSEFTTAKLNNLTAFVSSSGVVDDISRECFRLFGGVKKILNRPVGFVNEIILTGVVAYEKLSEKLPAELYSNSTSYKAGLSVTPFENQAFTIKSNYGDDYRPPTFNERYYSLLYSHYDLKSEKYQWFDFGFDYSFNLLGETQVSVSYFNIKGNNKIIWIPTRMAMQIPRNVACFETSGFELTLIKSFLNDALKINTSYNYTDARNKTKVSEQDLSYDKFIMYTPLHRFNAGLQANVSIFSFSVSASYVGERFYSTDNVYKLSSYLILDASVRGSFYLYGRKNTVALTAYNLADENYFIIQSYPMPLRSFLITYNLELL